MLRFKSFSPPSPFLDQGPGEGRGPAEFHDLARILKLKKNTKSIYYSLFITSESSVRFSSSMSFRAHTIRRVQRFSGCVSFLCGVNAAIFHKLYQLPPNGRI